MVTIMPKVASTVQHLPADGHMLPLFSSYAEMTYDGTIGQSVMV